MLGTKANLHSESSQPLPFVLLIFHHLRSLCWFVAPKPRIKNLISLDALVLYYRVLNKEQLHKQSKFS